MRADTSRGERRRKRAANVEVEAAERPEKLARRETEVEMAQGAGNGAAEARMLGTKGEIERSEYIRLLQQALKDIGYEEIAEQLQKQSGIACEADQVPVLRKAIQSGDWAAATGALDGLSFASETDRTDARFWILERSVVELIEDGKTDQALETIRKQVAPLGVHSERVHDMAASLLLPGIAALGTSGAETDAAANGHDSSDPSRHDARKLLLSRIESIMLPSMMVPERRLETLLEQALSWQAERCVYLNTSGPRGLMRDADATRDQLPGRLVQVLENHADEVWHVAFSPDGALLAAACRDGSVSVYDVDPVAQSAALRTTLSGRDAATALTAAQDAGATSGHGDAAARNGNVSPAVGMVAWQPPPRGGGWHEGQSCRHVLLTHALNGRVTIWDAETGTVIRAFDSRAELRVENTPGGSEPQGVSTWHPSGQSFISSSGRTVGWFRLSTFLQRYPSPDVHRIVPPAISLHRASRPVNDVAAIPGTDRIVMVMGDRRLGIMDLVSGAESHITLSEPPTSCIVSSDARRVLASTNNAKLLAWELDANAATVEDCLAVEPAQEFNGQPDRKVRFVVRSCFGGLEEAFVAAGCEDSQVYVWHASTGRLLSVLPGHSGTVNAVAWSPTALHLMASASDDRSVHLWGVPPALLDHGA
ncbi:unnamed protein product [Pedinophyceae sp. YPF-701]|nr:unnamed protein product [Pedinophyceae sp. YPF-701]